MMGVLTLSAQSIYDFTVKDDAEKDVSLAEYKGKVLLIVNTATRCGFTPQYKELEALYERYSKDGLEILDFPGNQFGEQAPGTIQEIHSFCTANFDIHFPQFDKIEVNGANELNYILAIGYPDEQPEAKPRDTSKVKYIK